MRTRLLIPVLCAVLVAGVIMPLRADADPTPSPVQPALVDEAEALRQAKASGQAVEVTALTDERTVVTADPTTGGFTAELTANVARVRDGRGGWRAPSSTLVRGADGLLRPEAAAVEMAVSPGGSSSAPLAVLTAGGASLHFGWGSQLPDAIVDGETATYPEVYPGVDLVVQVGLESVELAPFFSAIPLCSWVSPSRVPQRIDGAWPSLSLCLLRLLCDFVEKDFPLSNHRPPWKWPERPSPPARC